MADQDSSLPAEDALQSQQAIEDLERQVAEAQAELEEYQGLLNELPGIYEEKFRQKLRNVAEELRHLLDERKALQEQVSRALVQSRAPEALLPAAAVAPAPRLRSWSYVRLPRFQSPSSNAPFPRRPLRSRLAFRFSIPTGRRRGVALGAGLVLALLVLGLPQLLSRRSVPEAGGPPASAGVSRRPWPLPPTSGWRPGVGRAGCWWSGSGAGRCLTASWNLARARFCPWVQASSFDLDGPICCMWALARNGLSPWVT